MSTNASDQDSARFSPSEEWIDAFKRECTHRLRLDLKEYARRRARGVRRVGGHVDESYTEDLVANAIADTLTGVVTWDPIAKPLYQHLEDTIKYRTRHDRHRAKRFRHQRIDAPVSPVEGQSIRGLVEASLRQDQCNESAESTIFASEVVEQLRALAAGDDDILRYLDAILAGAQSRTEIIEHTQLSIKAFRNTRLRLDRLVDQLDLDFQAVAPVSYARGVTA